MRTPAIAFFDETLNYCFSSSLEAILGPRVREEVYRVLIQQGITAIEVSVRFDDIVTVLTRVFGTSSRIIIHRTIVELYREYSQRIDFSYGDPLKERLVFLKDRVVSDHLYPRRSQETISFFDKRDIRPAGEVPEVDVENTASWSGLYRLKRGVGVDSNAVR